MITRRIFLTRSAAAAAGIALSSDALSFTPEGRLKNFGFISGIIEKELKGDWKAILKKVASFGYTEFETGDYLGDAPESFLKFCNDIGLNPVAGGINFTDKDEELKKSFDLLHKLKAKYAVTYWPWYSGGPFKLEDCMKSSDRLNYLGRMCRANGLVFCWHNHNKEFVAMEKGLPFDYLMNNTDSALVKCELDIYWVAKGEADPLGILKKYKGRYMILHIKDMARGDAKDFECPGSGIIDFAPIFREADSQGIEHYMVERDNVPDGMACLRSAGEYLKNLRF